MICKNSLDFSDLRIYKNREKFIGLTKIKTDVVFGVGFPGYRKTDCIDFYRAETNMCHRNFQTMITIAMKMPLEGKKFVRIWKLLLPKEGYAED